MGKSMYFIYNANAGKGKIRECLSDIINTLSTADFDITIYATQAPKEATQLILERGEQFDVIVCAGGDGTINEVLNAISRLEKKPACGYIPMGTVNDFASSLMLSKNPVEAAQIIADGHTFACDVGRFQDSHFNYIAAFGAFTEVSYETPQDLKNVMGRAAYFVDAIKRIPNLRGYDMIVKYDGKETEGTYIYGMVFNSKSVGGFSLEAKDQLMTLDDGKFEVILIRRPSDPIELERCLVALASKDYKNEFIDAMRVSEIEFIARDEVRWTLDGEDGGFHKNAKINCLRRAVEIYTPEME